MEKQEIYREQIGILKNEATHLWGSAFIVCGGSISMLFSEKQLAIILGWLGVIITLVLFNTYFVKRTEMISILKNMKE